MRADLEGNVVGVWLIIFRSINQLLEEGTRPDDGSTMAVQLPPDLRARARVWTIVVDAESRLNLTCLFCFGFGFSWKPNIDTVCHDGQGLRWSGRHAVLQRVTLYLR